MVAYPELGDYARTRILSPTGKLFATSRREERVGRVEVVVGRIDAYLRGKCVVGETMKVRLPGVQEREGFLLLLESHLHANLIQNDFNLYLFATLKHIVFFPLYLSFILFVILLIKFSDDITIYTLFLLRYLR